MPGRRARADGSVEKGRRKSDGRSPAESPPRSQQMFVVPGLGDLCPALLGRHQGSGEVELTQRNV